MRMVALRRTVLRSYCRAAALIILLLAPSLAIGQACVGDCDGDGQVTVDEIITGVNIALGTRPLSDCRVFDRNGSGEVEIDELIAAVGFALGGCPVVPTATLTATAAPSATSTPTVTPSGTATAVPASATPTPSATLTATETATPPEPTATQPEPTATEVEPTATGTAVPTDTPVAPTATPTQDGTVDSQFVAGRATLIANAMTALNSVVSGIVVGVNGAVSSSLVARSASGTPVVHQCPVSGTTTRDCQQTGFRVQLTLGAADCVAAGPGGGTTTFNGSVMLSGTGICPVPFGGTYIVDLEIAITPAQGPTLTINATLNGDLAPSINLSNPCLIDGLEGTITGPLSATLPDGTGTFITFDHTAFSFSNPVYNNDCVPLRYTFTFNGPAILGETLSGVGFGIAFQDLAITQHAEMTPVTVDYEGGIQSDCVGSLLSLATITPVAVASGELCPRDGHITISDGTMSSVYYRSDGSVDLDTNSDGVIDATYSSCLAAELLACNAPPM